uniref:Uncharacterized protein n=1 Tax=Anguilla anguilla TaxID=7936 RepID=A0A0E9UEW0_ANGAN
MLGDACCLIDNGVINRLSPCVTLIVR